MNDLAFISQELLIALRSTKLTTNTICKTKRGLRAAARLLSEKRGMTSGLPEQSATFPCGEKSPPSSDRRSKGPGRGGGTIRACCQPAAERAPAEANVRRSTGDRRSTVLVAWE